MTASGGRAARLAYTRSPLQNERNILRLSAGLGMVVGWVGRRDDTLRKAFGYSVVFAAVGVALAPVNWRLRGGGQTPNPALQRTRAACSLSETCSSPSGPGC